VELQIEMHHKSLYIHTCQAGLGLAGANHGCLLL